MGFRTGTGGAKMIASRLRDGFSVQDCRLVLDYLSETWGADDKMREHLCPTTIFRPTNFDDRVVKAHNWHNAGRPSRSGKAWDRNSTSAFNLSEALNDTSWADNGLGL
ncbi:conserved phage C-terminal domain-containing protein [Serratia microhaemolytica]|uniref:conserved phage C-terminal domain-containing protein n=1 Tax=Serratia microhaemolytica TaxID=2675110 RepID=UPI003B837E43